MVMQDVAPQQWALKLFGRNSLFAMMNAISWSDVLLAPPPRG